MVTPADEANERIDALLTTLRAIARHVRAGSLAQAINSVLSTNERTQLDGGGERVDIDVSQATPPYESLDMYEKSHWRRYEFAIQHMVAGGATGDFACGTGYGTAMLARRSSVAIGADSNRRVIREITRRYRGVPNLRFRRTDLLRLDYHNVFDTIVSFETIEHFHEDEIPDLLSRFARALRPGGIFIVSTPFMQTRSPEALAMGFHRTFMIDESRLQGWLVDAELQVRFFGYQSYQRHAVVEEPPPECDFLIAVAVRN